jgi:hypothetical protein
VEVYLHAFLTSTLFEGEWSASRPGGFNPRKRPAVSIEKEAGWAQEPVWKQRKREKYPFPAFARN